MAATEMEGSEVGESSDEVESLLGCLIVFDSKRESETVSDGEKLFRDEGERVVVLIIYEKLFEYEFPELSCCSLPFHQFHIVTAGRIL
ncbi:hypothetical protein L195_g028340 [Trifolium pratense]|uniref:Uncharacterized protein n=1 Tax=Trifolium pratense TaxID=57577 RepID=A0A2K3L1N2_TRIPR|nr:hypothetical protein L195_g028340 [Trifolium pratense]